MLVRILHKFYTWLVMVCCLRYQAQLQKNLMYLAAIADAQPQTPAMPPQVKKEHSWFR